MKKTAFFIFFLFFSACGLTSDNSKMLSESEVLLPPDQYPDLDAVMRINEIKNGATPKVSPGKKTAPPPLPPLPPQSSQSSAQNTNTMPNQDLAKQFKRAVIKTNLGEIEFELYADKSPKTVNNFLGLAQQGFYNGTRFHRVIYDFMIQGGDPLSKDIGQKELWGTGGPGYKFEDEFNDMPLQKGSLAMANSGPNTNGSQFFIVTKDFTPWLDGKHTNFGFVTEGLDVVEKIQSVEVGTNDRPRQDVMVENIELRP